MPFPIAVRSGNTTHKFCHLLKKFNVEFFSFGVIVFPLLLVLKRKKKNVRSTITQMKKKKEKKSQQVTKSIRHIVGSNGNSFGQALASQSDGLLIESTCSQFRMNYIVRMWFESHVKLLIQCHIILQAQHLYIPHQFYIVLLEGCISKS